MIAEKFGDSAGERGIAPLSCQQERVWNLPTCEDDIIPPMALRIRGPLDIKRLTNALTAITRRQGVLRTSFDRNGLSARQIVSPGCDVDFAVINLCNLRREQRDSEALRIIRLNAMIPFDLGQPPLMRVRLLCLEEREHVLFFVVHHLIGDLLTMKILWREVASLYAMPAGSSLPALPVQYADYAVAQRAGLAGPLLEKHIDYLQGWARRAAEVRPPALPASGPETPRRGGVFSHSLSAEASAAVKRLSRENRVTVFMMFLALFQMFLRRHLGSQRLLIASMVANRPTTELESLMGVFATSLSLLIETPAASPLPAILDHTRDVCLDAYANQPLPPWQLAEVTNQGLDAARLRPQLSFSLQAAPRQPAAIPGLEVSEFACNGAAIFEGETAAIVPFDQAWEVWEGPDAYSIVVLYKQCFPRSLIEDMLQGFIRTIDSALDSVVVLAGAA